MNGNSSTCFLSLFSKCKGKVRNPCWTEKEACEREKIGDEEMNDGD